MTSGSEAPEDAPDIGQTKRAQEVRQDSLLRHIQDVAISTRIAIDHATRALDHAQNTLVEAGDRAASAVGDASKEAKRRVKELERAEKKLQKSIAEMGKVRTELQEALRGRR